MRTLRHRVGQFLTHPTHQLPRELQHKPARLQKQNKSARLDHGTVRRTPAHQHFGAEQSAALQIDDRLVVRHKLIVPDRSCNLCVRIRRLALGQEQREQQDHERNAPVMTMPMRRRSS